jgi:hypothetical protein
MTLIDVAKHGVPIEGTKDATGAIASLMREAAVGDTILIPTGAVCLIDPAKSIRLKQGVALQVDGTAKAKATSADWGAVVLALSLTDPLICGSGLIQGASAPGEHGMGVAVVSCKRPTVRGLRALGCHGDGFYFSWHWGGDHRSNNTDMLLEDVRSEGSHRNNLSITGCINAPLVPGEEFRGVRRFNPQGKGAAMPMAGIGFEPDAGWDPCWVKGLVVEDSVIPANGYQGGYAYRWHVEDLTLRRVAFTGGAKYGFVDDGTRTRFENCTSAGSTSADLVLRGTGTRVIGGSYARSISVQGHDIQVDTLLKGKPWKKVVA